MSNSPLVTYTLISPNKNSPRNHAIDRISIHCFVGQVSAKRGCEVFQPVGKQASCNYVVGFDGGIGLCVDEKDRSWCTSSGANDHRAVTIEVASDTQHPYAVTEKAYAALLDLVTDICRRNGKTKLLWFGDKDKTLAYTPKAGEMVLTVHRWFADKACPGEYLYSRHSQIASEVTKRLGSTSISPEPEKPDTGDSGAPGQAFEVGDIVDFLGGKHYSSANAATGTTVKASRAKVTQVYRTGKHPYHLRAVNDAGAYVSGVYGWVDADTIGSEFKPYLVKVTTDELNIRKEPGTDSPVCGSIKDRGVYTIVAEDLGPGSKKWGKLKSGAGWIALDLTKKI